MLSKHLVRELSSSKQLSTDHLLMIHFYYFNQRILLKNLKIISRKKQNKIKTNKKFNLNWGKRFPVLSLYNNQPKKKSATSIHGKPTFSGVFTNFKIFILHICRNVSRVKLPFVVILDYAPIARTSLGKLNF